MTSSECKTQDLASTTSPVSASTFTIKNGTMRLNGLYVNTAVANEAISIVDYNASVSPETSRTIITIPAATAAGTQIDLHGTSIRHSLRITAGATTTGSVTVFYTPGIPGNR